MNEITERSLIVAGPPRRRGRPRGAEARTIKVEFLVTPEERKELERARLDLDKPLGVFIREAVSEYVADYSERRVFQPRIPTSKK